MNQRIVVKIGSSSLTSEQGGLDRSKIAFFANELLSIIANGHQIVLVTSGAVAAGFTRIGYSTRPKQLHEKQAAAAVGQALLMQAYQEQFNSQGVTAAQILLTRQDFANRKRGHNAWMTIEELIKQGVIPIVNENDTVSVDELKFGDNDTLSALVANLVHANQLVIITDTDGLYTADPRKDSNAKKFEHIEMITEEIYSYAGGAGSTVGTGGMRSKLDAAKIAMRGGVKAFVGSVQQDGDLRRAVEGVGTGTYFATKQNGLPVKKQWLGFHSTPLGTIVVDGGAEQALLGKGSSLLPVGVHLVQGDFHAGDVVEVTGIDGKVIGRGIVNYEHDQLMQVAGCTTADVLKKLNVPRIEVIHRDEWVTLR
ncbi:glutamate 5-kinase [Paenibacillus sp. SC116]|uniref:glutamate 5-kinase n=1 Tax=Paenibacillus sp. SC116 TaxID=2968986 RepID=UPI00215A77E1|nr:glutamate 5-kinase [Paenibacillus sp. SC116]MCR8842906.1 glutamate 5-kinase [Paenibacillus sp. SC116]